MAGIDTHRPCLAVYPWPVGFDQPDSPNYIPTRELVASCHGIGKSYLMWRNIRNWAAFATVGVTATSFLLNDKIEARKRHLLEVGAAAGIGLIAGVFTSVRDRQYKKCVDNVAIEFQRRHEAEVAEQPKSERSVVGASDLPQLSPWQVGAAWLMAILSGATAFGLRATPTLSPSFGSGLITPSRPPSLFSSRDDGA